MKSGKFAIFNRRALNAVLVSAVALGGVTISGYSFAVQASATATAIVVVPISITKEADLSFGKFAHGSGGSITVSTSGVRSVVGVVPLTSSSTSAARFDVTGEANTTYGISHSGSATLASNSDSMALAKFSDLTGGNATSNSVTSGTLGAGGTQSIYVGGTLTVDAAQAAHSDYTGTITVTVEYN